MTSTPDPAARPRERLTASDFDYSLPTDLIAHHPAPERDASRLLVVRRECDTFEHRGFRDIVELFTPGDVIVLNETRVIPARLLARRAGGGEAEVLLLGPAAGAMDVIAGDAWPDEWLALVRPGAKLRAGRRLAVAPELEVEIMDVLPDGTRRVRLHSSLAVRAAVERFGRMPLPPYIERPAGGEDAERYQTVYARTEGSVAAPTAGLHFTAAVLDDLRRRGVDVAKLVLHVGVGTFRPVEVEDPAEHVMHAEWYEVTQPEADRMNEARTRGGRLWAVGTTVTRTLETVVERPAGPGAAAGRHDGVDDTGPGAPPRILAGSGWTRLFIRPGFEFRAVDRLVTNFHLPRSTLLMLVSAFAGHERTMRAYGEAIRERYRFYSYGDAMVIL